MTDELPQAVYFLISYAHQLDPAPCKRKHFLVNALWCTLYCLWKLDTVEINICSWKYKKDISFFSYFKNVLHLRFQVLEQSCDQRRYKYSVTSDATFLLAPKVSKIDSAASIFDNIQQEMFVYLIS